jgi:putative membrane protein
MWALWTLWQAAEAHTGAVPVRGVYDWSNLPAAAPDAWWVWEFYPSVVLGCLAFSAAYEWMARVGRVRWALSDVGPTSRERFFYHLSILVVFFSLQGPMHELADVYLFAGHMVQHLLITLVFPPMALASIPGWMWRPVLRRPWLLAIGRRLTHPIVAIAFCNAILYLWHVPAMYDWALYDHNVHIVEHLSFMTGYVVQWWPAMNRSEELPALSAGPRMVYLFTATLPMKLLGALLTMSDYVLYTYYAQQPRVFGLDPFEDQRLGGIIMWLPGGLVFWVLIARTFFLDYYADILRERNARGRRTGAVSS